MSREVEYRRYAAALLDLAKRAGDAADKFRLVIMADAWVKLADKIGRSRWPRDATRHEHGQRTAQDQATAE